MVQENEVVEIDFGGGRVGIVPLGTYLRDAARRMGVAVVCESGEHQCDFRITAGSELLSERTAEENEALGDLARDPKNRLGCFAQIEKPGVIVVMPKKETEEKVEEKNDDGRDESYRKEFAEMPLEKKIANLVQLEAIAVSETLAYVINSPFTVFNKIGDVLAEFGFKKEEAEHAAKRPAEKKESNKTKRSGSAKKEQPAAEA